MLYVERIFTLEQEIQLTIKAVRSTKKEILIRSGELDSKLWADPRIVAAIKEKVHYSPEALIECLKQGEEFAQEKEYGEAVANFDKARKILEDWESGMGVVQKIRNAVRGNPLMRSLGYMHNNISFCYLQMRKHSEAEMHLILAKNCNPGNSFAYNNLAEVHERTGRTGSAIDLYKKALKIMPNHPTAKQSLERALSVSSKG